MSDTHDLLLGPATGGLFAGVAIAVVTNAKDPQGLGRVRLKLPWLADDVETDWVRVATPTAFAGGGMQFQPRVDDEVLVAFQHGDPGSPIVIGSLWNGKDAPPDRNAEGKGEVHVIRSRSGHVVRFTDTEGKERLEILDKSGKSSIVIDVAAKTLTVTGEKDLVVQASQGKLTLSGKAGVEITSDAEVKVTAKSQLSLKANGSAELNGGGQLTLKGGMVNIN